jgi:hypothetical protein
VQTKVLPYYHCFSDLYKDLNLSDRLIALEKEWPGAVLLLLKTNKLTPVSIVTTTTKTTTTITKTLITTSIKRGIMYCINALRAVKTLENDRFSELFRVLVFVPG